MLDPIFIAFLCKDVAISLVLALIGCKKKTFGANPVLSTPVL